MARTSHTGGRRPLLDGRARLVAQAAATFLSNAHLAGFVEGTVQTGPSKAVCVPGLNCYSCPGAVGACPIGSLQAVLASRDRWVSFYVTGFLVLVGSLLGRLVCGWLCPFGLVQDLLHKIPFPLKPKVLPGERWLRGLRYVVLGLLVVMLPLTVLDLTGQGQPWFCEYLCPSGTLFAGIPLVAANPDLQAALGWLFDWKVAILVACLLASVVLWRPFCRYLCPLGAIYGLFNPIALYRYQVDEHACTGCGACHAACPMDIDAHAAPNSHDCVRCGACKSACPTGALVSTWEAAVSDRLSEDARPRG